METNYKPSIVARSLNPKRTKLIGVLIGDITNGFSNQIVKGLGISPARMATGVMIGEAAHENVHSSDR